MHDHALITQTVALHADSLLRVARRYTHCDADAEDAYQRALEIFVKSAHRLDAATVHKWLHTVVKHEAWAVREQRSRYVGVDDELTLDALDDGRHVASVEERSERFEELTRAAEALGRLKPQEVTALVLKAQGLSYKEIAERQGWTYTKVNRCITEGRRSFLQRYEGIGSGAECERWAEVLSAMADGEATAQQLVDVRPHLRNCSGCRAMLGGMQSSGAAVAGVLPPALLTGGGAGTAFWERLHELVLGAQERLVAPVMKAQGALEAASATKVAAVAASAAAIAGGGVAVERGTDPAGAQTANPPAAAVTAQQPQAASAAPTTAPDPSGATAPEPANEPATVPPREEAAETPAPGAEFSAEGAAAGGAGTPEVTDAPSAGEFSAADGPAAPEPEAAGAADEFGFGG
jgi:RNA polymerase sigma factor (sigma-70 family)